MIENEYLTRDLIILSPVETEIEVEEVIRLRFLERMARAIERQIKTAALVKMEKDELDRAYD